MSDSSASPLSGEVLEPESSGLDVQQVRGIARQIVDQLHQVVPGPAAAQLSLCMAMVIIDRTANDIQHTDEEFIGQITTTIRMLLQPPEKSN